MNTDDLNFSVREDGCITCDDPEYVRVCVNQHDALAAALREIVLCHLQHKAVSGDAWDRACHAVALADDAAGGEPRSGVPYPEFCRHPEKCAGLSTCPRDPCCCD